MITGFFRFWSLIHVDSVENQEGGAMYISCGDDAVAVEAEMGYVPNNPLFGLPLDSPQVNLHFTFCNKYRLEECWNQYEHTICIEIANYSTEYKSLHCSFCIEVKKQKQEQIN